VNYSFEDYERAILDALIGAAGLGYLKVIEGYSGQFDDRAVWDLFYGRFPGVLAKITDAEYEETKKPFPPHILKQTATVALYIGAISWRDQADARGGAKGAYTVLKDLRTVLLGNNLGLEIRPLLPLDEAEIVHGFGSRVVLYVTRYTLINDRILSA
jgi:hypothetical protein